MRQIDLRQLTEEDLKSLSRAFTRIAEGKLPFGDARPERFARSTVVLLDGELERRAAGDPPEGGIWYCDESALAEMPTLRVITLAEKCRWAASRAESAAVTDFLNQVVAALAAAVRRP